MPTGAGRSAGRVSVRVVPDSSGFGRELKADLDKIERGLKVQVKAALDDTALKASLEKLRSTDVAIDVQANTAGVRAEIERVGRSGGKVEVPVSLSGANIVRAELIRLATNRVIDLVVNVNKRSLVAAGSVLASLSGGRNAVGYLRGIGSALANLDKSVPKLALVATSVAGIGAAGLASVSGALSLASSLVAVSGAAVALPGIFAGFGLASATLKVALSTAKTSLHDLVPELTRLKNAIGGSFFSKAQAPIENLVHTVTGQLRPAFEGLSVALGGVAAQLANSVQNAIDIGVVKSLFDNVTAAVRTLQGAIAPLVSAFGVLVDVGASRLPALAQSITDLSTRFDNFISTAAGDGSLDQWVNTGIAGLKSLGSVVGSVGEILKGLFDAANTAGGGNGLAAFAANLRAISDAINSTGLQTALSTIFTGALAGAAGLGSAIKPIGGLLQTLASTLSGVFEVAGQTIGNVLAGIAGALSQPAFAQGLTSLFAGIATGVNALLPVLPVLGEAFGQVLSALGPVAAQLGPVFAASFAAVAPAVSQVVQALTPLIPILGQALADSISVLSVALVSLAPIFAAVIQAVAPLIPVLATALTGAIMTLAPAILQIVQAIGGSLPAVISAITATVAVLAPVLAQVITAIVPLVPAILSLIPPLLQVATAILPVIPALVAQIVPLVLQLVPLIIQILAAILPLVPSFLELVVAGTQLAAAIQGPIFSAFGALVGILPTVVSGLQGLLGIVTAFVQGAVALFSGNFRAIPGIVSGAVASVKAFIQSGLAGTFGLIVAFVANAIGKFASFASSLASTISSAMSRFGSAVSSGLSTALGYFKALPGKVLGALSGLAGSLSSAGLDIMRGLARGIANGVGIVVEAIKSAVSSAVSSAKSALGIHSPSTVFRDEIGRHIPTGVVAGIQSTQGQLDSALANMVQPSRLASVTTTGPSFAATASTGGSGGISIGSVVGTDVDELVRKILLEMRLQEAANAATGWR